MSWGYGNYGGFGRYVSAAEKRARAAKQVEKLKKKGQALSAIQIEGTKIAKTFWGKAWCSNLEAYSDYSNRLPRGRTYVRNGSVLHLEIKKGEVNALVAGSSLYKIHIQIAPANETHWKKLCDACSGGIGSLVELLEGRLSSHVMEIMTAKASGLFPSPKEIKLDCSCPDWADMCKHVAAALYGVGARLDQQPELLFLLRGVDHNDLLAQVVSAKTLGTGEATAPTVAAEDLHDVFGIEITPAVSVAPTPAVVPAKKTAKRTPKAPIAPLSSPKKKTRQTKVNAKPAPKKIAKKLAKKKPTASTRRRRSKP